MNINKMLLWTSLTLASSVGFTSADETITCDAFQYAQALTQVQQVYIAEKNSFEKSLTAINCLNQNINCDQVKMASLSTAYQARIQNITNGFVQQDRSTLCYDIKSSTALSMATDLKIMTITPAAISITSTKNKPITTSNTSSADEGWIRLYSAYTSNCMNTQAALTTCASQGKTLVSCRQGPPEEDIDFFGSRTTKTITRAEVKCGGAANVDSKCSQVYRVEGSAAPVCLYSEAQWNNLKSCFAADKIQERATNCSKGCQGYPNYHVCDWTVEEWNTYGTCMSLAAQDVRKKLCPNSNPDVNEDGPSPRISLTGFRKTDAPYNTFIISPSNNLSIAFTGIKGNSGSYCVNKVGSSTCSNNASFTPMKQAATSSSGSATLTSAEISPGSYVLTALNNTTGKTTSVNFAALDNDTAFPCIKGIWKENTDSEFSPRAPNGSYPSSYYSGKECPCTKDPEQKDSSGLRWQCSAGSALSNSGITGVDAKCVGDKGSFCNEDAKLVTEWIHHTCPGKPAGGGWGDDQGDNYYHRFTQLKCGQPTTINSDTKDSQKQCKVMNGEFCGGSTITEWVHNGCGSTPDGAGWVPQGDNYWHRATTRTCGNSCNPVKQGQFCGGTDMTSWITLPAGCAHPGAGWNAQGNDTYHKGGGAKCSTTPAVTTAPSCAPIQSGSFCGGSNITSWVTLPAGCPNPGPGWNAQGNDNYHKGGGPACGR